MRATKEIDGTSLLDNAVFVVGSGLSDANNHVHNDVPMLLIGGAQGRIRGGRHVRYPGEPVSNLHMTVMEMFNVPTEEYFKNETADATGTLPGIT